MKPFIGNKSAEKDIRDWLLKNGYHEKSARFAEIELHAIKRPGWLQVFRFELTTLTAHCESVQLFGAMYSDDRYGEPKITVHEAIEERDSQLLAWSEGLITQRRYRK